MPEPDEPMDGGQIKVVDQKPEPTHHVEQEVLIEGLYSYGNYKIFASGYDDKLYTAGVEYNRHSWGNFLKGADGLRRRIPALCSSQQAAPHRSMGQSNSNFRKEYSADTSTALGFRPSASGSSGAAIRASGRFLRPKAACWASPRKLRQPRPRMRTSACNRWAAFRSRSTTDGECASGLFGDFHFSNAFIVPANPGLDVMNANLALSYHF